MATFSEGMKRTKAYFADLGVGIFNATQDFLPFVQIASQGGMLATQLAPAFSLAASSAKALGIGVFKAGLSAITASGSFILMAVQGLGSFVLSMGSAIAAQIGLNIAMTANPIGLIIVGIAAAIAAVVALVYYWDEIKAAIWEFIKWSLENNPFAWLIDLIDLVFPGAKQAIFDFFSSIWEWIEEKFMKPLMKAWDWLKNASGFGDNTEVTVKTVDEKKTINEDLAKSEVDQSKLDNIGGGAASKVLSSDLDGGSSGGGSNKTITMNLEIKQTFNVAGNVKQSIEDIANETIRMINDKLRDGLALA